jgi:hypothetical protein
LFKGRGSKHHGVTIWHRSGKFKGIRGTFDIVQGTLQVIRGTFGIVQGTFQVIWGIFGTHEFNTSLHATAR